MFHMTLIIVDPAFTGLDIVVRPLFAAHNSSHQYTLRPRTFAYQRANEQDL